MPSVFLAFHGAGISRDESGLFEWRAKIRVYLHQGTGDSMANSTGLAGGPAPRNVNIDIKAASRLRKIKRLQYDHPGSFPPEILLQGFVVDEDSAFARFQEDSSD